MEGKGSKNTCDREDGFSFRPQREKTSSIPKELKSAGNIFQQPRKWSAANKRSVGPGYGGESRNYFPLLEYPDMIQAQLEVEEHFNKTFTFTPPSSSPTGASSSWALPPPDTMFTAPHWKDTELQQMKVSLNATKQKLGEKDISEWQVHTSNTNPAQKICYTVRRRAQPEMVTQAWLKFYEIVNAYPIVPNVGDETEGGESSGGDDDMCCDGEGKVTFNSLHLCEAPGAFITALNHYLALNASSVKWNWLGNTLNPYYEGTPLDQCITEDRFIYLTQDHWLFGRDNTGDLTKRTNLADIEERTRTLLGSVHLVTGDGSFDCQSNPAEQELMTHMLHLCEATAALSVLSPGGSLVLKKFTFFESQSLCMLFLLCCVFGEIHLFKPATSKQGNSEVYVIGLNYKGKEFCGKYLEKLQAVYGPNAHPNSMFAREDLPEDFVQMVRKCSAKFMAYQVNTIMRNLALFESMPEKDKQYNELIKSKAMNLFFERNYCIHIPKWKAITQGDVNIIRYLMDSDWNKTSSSMLVRSKDLKSKLEVLRQFLETVNAGYSNESAKTNDPPFSVTSSKFPKLEHIKFEVVKGKPFQYIESSKFCSERVLRVFIELQHMWLARTEKNGVHGENGETHGENGDGSLVAKETCDNGSSVVTELSGDDSLVATVLKSHPGAVLVRDEIQIGPHSGCRALEDILVSLKEGNVAEGGSVVIVGAQFLSRLQYSLLLVVAAAFKDIHVYTGQIGTTLPILVLDSLECRGSEEVVHALHLAGWSPGCSPPTYTTSPNTNSVTSPGCSPTSITPSNTNSLTLLQLVPLSSLLGQNPLKVVHLYNTQLCSHLSSILLTAISSTAEIHT